MKKAPTTGRRRKSKPKIVERKGVVMFECPFCFPPHPLVVDEESFCGTMLELIAVQRMYEGLKCELCGKGDGTLVKKNGQYIHDYDCKPGVMMLEEDPVPSFSAHVVYHLPEIFRLYIIGKRGQVPARLNHEGEEVFTWFNV